MDESRTYVFYDIAADPIRNKVSETCKDYGLKRVQFSGFVGSLSRNKREELCIKFKDIMMGEGWKIWVQPVCDRDAEKLFAIENQAPAESSEEEREGYA